MAYNPPFQEVTGKPSPPAPAGATGAIARPDEIRFAEALPKTRSGKSMRRLPRGVAAGKATSGDTTTLEALNVLATLRQDEE